MTLESHLDVIGLWASLKALSEESATDYETVAKWKQRKRIPSEHWEAIIATRTARKAKLSVRDLARIDAQRPWRSRA